jgi:uncharacterized ion transporter superfamily protein YfcC
MYDLLFWVVLILTLWIVPAPKYNAKRTKKPKAKKQPSLRTRVAQEKRELLEIKREYKKSMHNYQTNKMNPKMEKRNK